MNTQKTNPKKRKLNDVEDSSDDDSHDHDDEDSDSDDDSSDNEENKEDESNSDSDCNCNSDSSSSSGSSVKGLKKSKSSGNYVISSESSDSGDETREKCSICLRSIKNQEVGTPEVCDHLFCAICILEWSKNSRICPLDRQPFSIVLVRENKDGNTVKKVPVGNLQRNEDDPINDTVCEICGSGDREDILLLCDDCDRGFHTVCLVPPLESVPDEMVWYCPDCEARVPNRPRIFTPNMDDYFFIPATIRTTRHRTFMTRTRLLERIRRTVSRLLENLASNSDGSGGIDFESLPSEVQLYTDSCPSSPPSPEPVLNVNQPSTSGLQRSRSKAKKPPAKTKKKTVRSRKRGTKTVKKGTVRKRKTINRKRKCTTIGKKKPAKKRKSGVKKAIRVKKVKVENNDGTITEKIIKTRVYKKRKQKRKKRKNLVSTIARRRLRVKSRTIPKTPKGRLAVTLGMVPPKKPGQLLPEVKVRSSSSQTSPLDLSRARAGIPKLHIFGPRNELQYCSSDSDQNDSVESSGGGVATVRQPRIGSSRVLDRKSAALALQTASRAQTSRTPTPKPIIESRSNQNVDILGSILDSQAIWHSKNTEVIINEDGSIEIVKGKKNKKVLKPENEKKIDVREKNGERVTTQAPMQPSTSGSRPGGFRPQNRNNYGDSRANQDNAFSPRSGPSSMGMNFNRFGGPARNDREGYTNYLNSIPQGPTPIWRGGRPLRFRMPSRQQLRKITFSPKNRPTWNPRLLQSHKQKQEKKEEEEESEEESENENSENKKGDEGNEQTKTNEEDDIDLYSDIETNTSKEDNSGPEDGSTSYPALGPPPEPPAFLLGLDENGELDVPKNKDKSEVYDPAEPCDSDEEMVIDENKENSMTPERKESEPKKAEPICEKPPTPKEAPLEEKLTSTKELSEDDDEEDCPIFSIYSSATREFSQKEEEERQREIAEDKRKLEEMKLLDEQRSLNNSINPEKNDESEFDKQVFIKENIENMNLDKEQDETKKEHTTEKVESMNLDKYHDEARKEMTKNTENIESINLDKDQDETKKEMTTDIENVESRLFDLKCTNEGKELIQGEESPSTMSEAGRSISPAKMVDDSKKDENEKRSPSPESEKEIKSKSPKRERSKSSSLERTTEKYKRSKRKSRTYDSDSDSEAESKKVKFISEHDDDEDDDDKESEEPERKTERGEKDDKKLDKVDFEIENEVISQKVTTGLEGLDVEEVSSDNGDGTEFGDKRSLSSFSLSELSNASQKSRSPIQIKKKKKNKKKKGGKSKQGNNYEEGEIDDSEKDNKMDESFEASKAEKVEIENENSPKSGEKRNRKSDSVASDRQILGSKENKKVLKEKTKEKDLSWKKPSKKDKNYREGKKRSKERGRSKSSDRKKSKSPSPKKIKKKDKDRKKKTDKKKDIERYDVRKIVKNKEVRKTDAFGRDIVSKSRSVSRSRSRSPVRERSRNMLRRESRSFSRSRSRSFRRGRSPARRRYVRSRTRSRSKSLKRSYSRSRSRSRSRKSKKKIKSKDRQKIRSRSRGRKSHSLSRDRRRSISKSRSRSPVSRAVRGKKITRSRRSWSQHLSRSPSLSPRRSRSMTRSPIRVRRSYSRSVSSSWSRGRSPLPRTSSLEKLTVVLTTKDKKKWKKKKEGKKGKKEEKRKKKGGNSKEVFASGDNVLVSVNFRNNNNNNAPGLNSVAMVNNDNRNTRLNSLSPALESETSRKKKKGSDYESERVAKKSKKTNPISKKTVDVALSNACSKRAKKLTRLNEKDAEVILSRKPVAVIDLDMSPYREQTPSPVNVVVVSDSGSGDEGKDHTPQRQMARGTPGREVEKIQESVGVQSVDIFAPGSPVENGYIQTSGPKTPPEPQIKFSITKPQQLRQIANPLGDDDDEEDEVEEDEGNQGMETLDRRIEKELNPRSEIPHKGPNTPPAPRGPSTPKTPPSPQTSPDVYDPFEPTKSRSPSPSQADKENRPSPKMDGKDEPGSGNVPGDSLCVILTNSLTDNPDKVNDVSLENDDDQIETKDKGEAVPATDCSSNVVISNQTTCAIVSDVTVNESPEGKITVVITTPQSKTQTQNLQKPYAPVLKQLPMVSSTATTPTTSVNLTVSSDVFSMPSPTKTSRSSTTTTTQTVPMTGIQRLQHRLGSPVNRTPNSIKTTPEKRGISKGEANEILTSGKYMIRNVSKRNGEQPKQPRPLQDATNETIDITAEMDDSPYSPASSEGDDLFDPPVETVKPSQSKGAPTYKSVPRGPLHKSPAKQLSKFDLLFGPTLSPLKALKKTNAKISTKVAKVLPSKTQKKALTKKGGMHKMDEDQLRILDDLPSSAVELQVKDKFLKKLNRQERVVDEVKTVLKPHYARKHITKEEYKDILRRSVPKICHSKSGEINPSKIQSLIEAYVRKYRHAKKKGTNVAPKTKTKKTMFS